MTVRLKIWMCGFRYLTAVRQAEYLAHGEDKSLDAQAICFL